ncbi:MAG: NADH dehydrogenase subunit 5 [Bacillota bacterium]|nr:NADH dehydrogenase subunit 5 [Bacillota bacterium]
MLDFMSIIFFILLTAAVLSGFILLSRRIPLSFVRIHIGIISLPPIAALLSLIVSHKGSVIIGPWRLDSLSWLVSIFVLLIGLIVQKYSVRYLYGDRSYRKYFTLLTITTVADALTWLCNDLRLLIVCWGLTLFGLTLLIRVKKEWQVALNASRFSGRLFVLSCLLLLAAFILVSQATGHWQLSHSMTQTSLNQIDSKEKTFISFLLIVAVMIPAAQWPFQRWLLDSAVTPTPVSAVMHAGIVNAGAMMLTRFAPLINGDQAQIVLLVLSGISVLLGTGIMLVHVDYKRQLVGSTIAQMGFMLIQCALGAYSAAIIHAVLHGFFKSSLFLQAGSAIHHKGVNPRQTNSSTLFWKVAGGVLGLLVGICYWLTSPGVGYSLVSTITLGWSVSLAWTQLVAFGSGRIGKVAGFLLLAGGAFVYQMIHSAFSGILEEAVHEGGQPYAPAATMILFILLFGSAFILWLAHLRSSRFFTIIYLWFVRLGEPKNESFESHPKYLIKNLSQGGNLR